MMRLCLLSLKSIQKLKLLPTYSIRNYHVLFQRPSNVKNGLYAITFASSPSHNLSWSGIYSMISESTPVMFSENVLIYFHQFSHLPWWAVIMLTTLSVRSFIVFPLALHQNQVIARLTNINVELGKLAPELNKEVNIAAKICKWDQETARKIFKTHMRDFYQKFVIRDNCHPFKTILLALLQVPAWVCLSVALRKLTFMPEEIKIGSETLKSQFETEGVLWFTDLTNPEMFVIPTLLAVVNLTLVEVHALRQIVEAARLQKILLYAMRSVVLVVALAAAVNPASVSFYWLCSSTFGLGQSLLFMSPGVRRALRIPFTPNESGTPYRDILSNFQKRMTR